MWIPTDPRKVSATEIRPRKLSMPHIEPHTRRKMSRISADQWIQPKWTGQPSNRRKSVDVTSSAARGNGFVEISSKCETKSLGDLSSHLLKGSASTRCPGVRKQRNISKNNRWDCNFSSFLLFSAL